MKRKNTLVKKARNFLSAGILLLCGASVALAQAGRGSISGLVSDPAGALIAGAKVVLLNPATGVTQHTVTTGAGLYNFISLNPGVYQVTASQGDLIVARKNNRHIIAGTPGRWLTNRDVLRIEAATGRTVAVRRLAGRNDSGATR